MSSFTLTVILPATKFKLPDNTVLNIGRVAFSDIKLDGLKNVSFVSGSHDGSFLMIEERYRGNGDGAEFTTEPSVETILHTNVELDDNYLKIWLRNSALIAEADVDDITKNNILIAIASNAFCLDRYAFKNPRHNDGYSVVNIVPK